MSDTYTPGFYDIIRKGCQDSAAAVVDHLQGLDFPIPQSVIDVGCGEGWWAMEFERRFGASVEGVDGEYVESSPLRGRFVAKDLSKVEKIDAMELGQFDLAVCLEVAEHLPEDRAQHFVGFLCGLAPAVLFSAAIPGQGGAGHVNEQWPLYWAEKFERNGYAVSGALRFYIWEDTRIENWYRQNLMLAVDQRTEGSHRYDSFFTDRLARYPHALVHPVLFDARRA